MFQKIDDNNLVEQPLGYWEKNSYMSAITDDDLDEIVNCFFDRISNIEGVTIKEKQELTNEEPGQVTIEYDGEDYYVGFYPTDFSLPEVYITNKYYFSNEELHKLRNANKALTIFMKFNKDAQKSYHLQLKLIANAVPNLLGVMDESAEKIEPAKWVVEMANSKILPSPIDLLTVHAVVNEDDEIWLHTHGLCRCGITELEILNSDKTNYNNHYNIITTFASLLLETNKDFVERKDYEMIGRLSNGNAIVVTYLSWTKALSFYDNLKVGNIEDRENGHNTRTSVIFLYKSKSDAENFRLSYVTDYNNLLGDNPMLFISSKETKRMKDLAVEKFETVIDQSKNKDCEIELKIALPIDGKKDEFEHIWFDLIDFEGEKFKAKLKQEPYDVKDVHEGDEMYFTVKDVTDWVIYTPKFKVTPDTTYLLTYKQ